MSGEEERLSRPSSLVLEAPAPQREPLHFDVQLIGAPPEVEQLVNNIKQVAEDFLYHWKIFPIVLPPSRFTGPGNRLSDVIIPPPCDEIDAAALDAGAEPEPLSPKQLQSIREKGEFEVASRHFPGQSHVWRVAGWLQRGRARAREELLRHAARALALVLVTARDRLRSAQPLSLRAGRAALLQGLHRLLDLLIGLPSMEARDLEKKIREERSRYLVAELICKPEHEEDIAAVAAWVSRAVRRAAAEKHDARDVPRPAPRLPLHYTTPQRTMVDLRLYRRDLLRRAAPALQAILEREARGWFLHFRERTAAHLAEQKVPPDDIEEEVRAAAMREYVARVCAAVEGSAALAALGPGVPALLAAQLRAGAALERAEERVRRRLRAGLAGAEARLRARHPVLARAASWRAGRLAAAARRLHRDLRWAAREDAAAALHALGLHQHRYFLLRDLAFLRDREPLLAAELRAATQPTRTFAWSERIWEPARWRVTRHRRGRASPVPTVVAAHAAPAAPRSDPAPVFLVRADSVRTGSTRWPGWRLANAAQRARCWTRNAMYVLAVAVAWDSPLSLRTLLRREPVVPDLELSQVDGTLVPRRSSETHTMWSRLLALWRRVAKERDRIDAEPDTGLLGGGTARALRRAAWSGAGALGSAALLLVFPLCVLVTCGAALLAAATAPLWVPPLALLLHACNALVYDADCPRAGLCRWFPLTEALLWRIGVLGVLQPLAALAAALVLCPLGALALAAGAAAWAGARGAWEALAWRAVIVRGARVPQHESAFCRRVAGPGLTAPAHYRLAAAHAAAAAAARAELDALQAWQQRVERDIERPLRDYEHFVDACFGPFSVQIAKTGSYRLLERECASLTSEMRGAAAARRRDLASPLSSGVRARCRLEAAALRRARDVAAAEVRRAWSAEPRGDEWWAARGLDPGDWHALASDALVECGRGGPAGGWRGAAAAGERSRRTRVGGAVRSRRAPRPAGGRGGRGAARARPARAAPRARPGRLLAARAASPAAALARPRRAAAAQQGLGGAAAAGGRALRRRAASARRSARRLPHRRVRGAVPRRRQLGLQLGRRRRRAPRRRERGERGGCRGRGRGGARARRVPLDADGARRAPARRPRQPRGRVARPRAPRDLRVTGRRAPAPPPGAGRGAARAAGR